MMTLTLTSPEAEMLEKLLNNALTSAEFTSSDDPTNDPEEIIQGVLDKIAEGK